MLINEPSRVLHLVNTAITALATGGQPALDNLIRDIDDHDLEALITHMAQGIGVHVRFSTTDQVATDRRPR